jgi:hypothetical protein
MSGTYAYARVGGRGMDDGYASWWPARWLDTR